MNSTFYVGRNVMLLPNTKIDIEDIKHKYIHQSQDRVLIRVVNRQEADDDDDNCITINLNHVMGRIFFTPFHKKLIAKVSNKINTPSTPYKDIARQISVFGHTDVKEIYDMIYKFFNYGDGGAMARMLRVLEEFYDKYKIFFNSHAVSKKYFSNIATQNLIFS